MSESARATVIYNLRRYLVDSLDWLTDATCIATAMESNDPQTLVQIVDSGGGTETMRSISKSSVPVQVFVRHNRHEGVARQRAYEVYSLLISDHSRTLPAEPARTPAVPESFVHAIQALSAPYYIDRDENGHQYVCNFTLTVAHT